MRSIWAKAGNGEKQGKNGKNGARYEWRERDSGPQEEGKDGKKGAKYEWRERDESDRKDGREYEWRERIGKDWSVRRDWRSWDKNGKEGYNADSGDKRGANHSNGCGKKGYVSSKGDDTWGKQGGRGKGSGYGKEETEHLAHHSNGSGKKGYSSAKGGETWWKQGGKGKGSGQGREETENWKNSDQRDERWNSTSKDSNTEECLPVEPEFSRITKDWPTNGFMSGERKAYKDGETCADDGWASLDFL